MEEYAPSNIVLVLPDPSTQYVQRTLVDGHLNAP